MVDPEWLSPSFLPSSCHWQEQKVHKRRNTVPKSQGLYVCEREMDRMGRASLQACLSEHDAWNRSEGPYPTASHAEGRHHTQATEELSYLARWGGAAWDRRGSLPSELSPRILPATQQGVEPDSRLCPTPLPENSLLSELCEEQWDVWRSCSPGAGGWNGLPQTPRPLDPGTIS